MKKLIVIMVMLTMLVGVVFAQSIPGGFVSPQSAATQGRIRSAADDFIRPDAYTGVSFERWYSMASFANTGIATLGYAKKFGGGEGGNSLYLSVFYNGSFWNNVTSPAYTEDKNEFPITGEKEKNVPVYGRINLGSQPSNQIALLIGAANMGFRISYRTTHETFAINGDSLIDTSTGNAPADYTAYKSYEIEKGMLSPQIAWSLTKNLVDLGIKPWVTFDLTFNRNNFLTQGYTQKDGKYVAAKEEIYNSENTIAPEFNVGLGGITLANKNGWRTNADFEYRLQITSYSNDYNYTDSKDENAIKSFNGAYNPNRKKMVNNVEEDDPLFSEISYNSHRIRPILSTQWNGDKLRLRVKLDLNMIISNTVDNPMDVKIGDKNGTLVINGKTADTFGFQFNPDFQLAAQWQAASKLFLNAGGRINLVALNTQTTEGKTYANGKEPVDSNGKTIDTSYRTKTTTYGATQNHINLGVTLNATDNLSVEATTGLIGTSKSTNNANVFDTTDTGLLNFSSILVSVKF